MKPRLTCSISIPVLFVLASSWLAACGEAGVDVNENPLATLTSSRIGKSPQTDSEPNRIQQTPTYGIDQDIDAIRKFAGDPALQLEYRETTVLISSPNADVMVNLYQDGWGASYYLDQDHHQVVEFSFGYLFPPLGEILSLDELRAKAHELFGLQSPPNLFPVSDLLYEEGAKGEENYFFRWQDAKPGWRYNPPIFQVGLRADGMLINYINTLVNR